MPEAMSLFPGEEAPRGEKSARAYRTISEVAEDLGVATHVLRFWESRFSNIRPMKRSGGRRYYRPEDVDLLRQIKTLLYEEGYTIRGVQAYFKKGADAAALPEVARPADADTDWMADALAELRDIRALLDD